MRSTLAATPPPPLKRASRGGKLPGARVSEHTCVFKVHLSLVCAAHSFRGTSLCPLQARVFRILLPLSLTVHGLLVEAFDNWVVAEINS